MKGFPHSTVGVVVSESDGRVYRARLPLEPEYMVEEAGSVRAFLMEHLGTVKAGGYAVEPFRGMPGQSMKLLSTGGVSKTTGGVTVEVRAFRVLEVPQIGYAYRVKIYAEEGYRGETGR